VIKTVRHDANKTNGWLEETDDWLGRVVLQRRPEWNWTNQSDAILDRNYSYNSVGQLSSLATRDEHNGSNLVLPVHYYLYGNMGLLVEKATT